MKADFYDTRHWSIYVLKDETGGVRYVGVTNRMAVRLTTHISEARYRSARIKSKKCSWIKSMLNRGVEPTMEEVEKGFGPSWAEREIFWIEKFRSDGADLANMAKGGPGCPTPMSLERRKKVSERSARQKQTPDAVERSAAKRRGQVRTPEQRSRMSAAQRGTKKPNVSAKLTGRKLPPERVAKMKGKTQSPKNKEALRLAHVGRARSDETKAKIRAAHVGKKLSDEAKAKISAAHTGMRMKPETVEKLRQSQLLVWEKKRLAKAQGQVTIPFCPAPA